jgi:hypothetical protein
MPVVAARRLLIERPAVAVAALVEGTAAPTAWAAVASVSSSVHPWDRAHELVSAPTPAVVGGPAAVSFAEPDFEQVFPFPQPSGGGMELFRRSPCDELDYDRDWEIGLPHHGWHRDDAHSQLKAALAAAGDPGDGNRVRIGILDTGYDPDHTTLPAHLRTELARNFADADNPDDATDPNRKLPGNQPGHGTATLALLAGTRVKIPGHPFDDFLGGAPHADVVPVRIADSVIHFRTSSMADGITYAAGANCRVLSISMGGIPSRAWARAVNEAYEAGLTIFAAAGNHFGRTPPRETIWPARFGRVVAVCGAQADGSPYHMPGIHFKMHGCFGPPSVMGTAMAAYTPNVSWALLGCRDGVGFAGGTSSATPQCAAAATLWLQTHPDPAGVLPWQRVEAVRHALFSTADRSHPQTDRFYGRGILKAARALTVPFRTDLAMTPPDDVSFPWLRILTPDVAVATQAGRQEMFEVEALQVFLETARLQELAGGADPIADAPPPREVRRVLRAMRLLPSVSNALRNHLTRILRRA